MKKQIAILALACTALVLPAVTGQMSASAQVQKNKQKNTNDFRINYLSSTEEASKFSVHFSDADLKNPSLKIIDEKGEEIYDAPITDKYMVFKVMTEEPAGKLTFALYDGKKKVVSRTWQISAVSETKIVATETR